MAKRRRNNPFIQGLIDRYREARSDEDALEIAFQAAGKALSDNRETQKLCAALLRKEGFDPEEVGEGIDSRVVQAAMAARAATNGNSTQPLNATHAVYLVMRKHNNDSLLPEDIAKESASVGLKLALQEVNKVLWTQTKKERTEKLEDGRFRLTAKGEAFKNFRRKPAEQEDQTAEAIKD